MLTTPVWRRSSRWTRPAWTRSSSPCSCAPTPARGPLTGDDLRRCRVPRLPLAEQRRYGDVFRHLHELQGALSALAAVSANVIEQTIHGLTTGALSPAGPGARKASNDLDALYDEMSRL